MRPRDLDTDPGQQRTRQLFELSLKRDPDHALSHALFAFSLAYSANVGAARDAESKRTEARDHVGRALSLERRDPAVINSCVWALNHLGEIERASTLAERAYEYFPIWDGSPISYALIERREYARALTLLNEHLAYHPEPNPTARDGSDLPLERVI